VNVEVVLAWPRRFESVMLELDDGATVADAMAQAALSLPDGIVAHAIHGVRVETSQVLRDGDRIELLRPLVADPKDARRRRAADRIPKR
jgi:putative ubiquitin-RnfH superfamily antitoxin RatB of RatAB toxin-antitoxin module